MDTTSLKLLAQAVQKMAWTPEAVRSNLRALRARGILPAVTASCVAGEEEEGACCDPESDVPGEEDQDSGDGNDGTIDGERPDDGSTEKGMDGQFRGPDGELFKWDDQPCKPDPYWQLGYYWRDSSSPFGFTGATPASVFSQQLGYYGGEITGPVTCAQTDTQTGACLDYKVSALSKYDIPVDMIATRLDCGSSTADYCQLTTAPCAEDQEWPSDSKCQEALINGQFVPHPKDPDCASTVPRDYQTMCQNGKCVTYIPTNDGGHMRVTVDPVTRLPTSESTVTYYNSAGKARREESYRKRNVELNAYSENSIPGNWE